MKRVLGLLCMIVVLGAVPALADAPQTGTLEGRVLDAGGGPLPGITVTLLGDRGEQTTTTDGQGRYLFGLLPPGVYTVMATVEGLEGRPITVRVETGQRRSQDLRTGAIEETITVVAETPLINKYDMSTGATVESEVVEELVFSSRNYQSVTTMMPGATQPPGSQALGDARTILSGTRWMENAVFVDGVDVSVTRPGGGTRLFLPSSAVTEVRADVSGFGTEYGRVTGGIIGVTTKSGTNELHGDFRYVAQNPEWRAQSEHVPVPRPDDRSDSFEVSIGGPITRDRVWFFVAAGRTYSNEPDALRDGTVVDGSLKTEPVIAKLNAQAGSDHSFSLTYVDVPVEKDLPLPATGDLYALPHNDLSGHFVTATWNWAATPNVFLEVRAADQSTIGDRKSAFQRELDSSAPPDTPLSTRGQWYDLGQGVRYNFVSYGDGELLEDFPRTQANAALTWFIGTNELKIGLDYQDISWEYTNVYPAEFRGAGYNPGLPGGFAQPQVKRVFVPADSPSATQGTIWALYAQDRLSVGDHWAFTLGLRVEDQTHDNDIGDEVIASTDVAPRLAAVYDVNADGRLLLKATLGRYVDVFGQEVAGQFGVKPSGANEFDEFAWNPATQQYDVFLRHFTPAESTLVAPGLNPYYKDEFTLGLDWQFADAWALEARATYWERKDLWWANDQIADDGSIFFLLDNHPEGERKYQGVQLELSRRFRSNWVLRANYTWSKAEGNVFGNSNTSGGGVLIDDDFLEASSVINPDTGIPYTADNRYGRGDTDRTHVLNISGAKVFNVGRHSLSLGAFFTFRSGERWGLKPPLIFAPRAVPSPFPVVVVPGLRGTIQSSRYAEPRDANQLPDTMSLNLTGGWTFPLGSRVEGNLRVEATNVTNEQEQMLVVLINGQAPPLRAGYQFPREFRFVAGLSF